MLKIHHEMSTYKQITSTSGYFLPEEERRSVHQHWARGSSPSPSPSGWAAPACTAGTPAATDTSMYFQA
jgi:hypothetical protein